jgi:hypothetical protein
MLQPEPAHDVESILALDPIDDPDILDWPKRYIARELGWIPIFDKDRTDAHGQLVKQCLEASMCTQRMATFFDLETVKSV